MKKLVIDRDKGWARVKREIHAAKHVTVLVGIQEGDNNPEGVSIAEYAAYNEYGTKNIPERSFVRSSFDERVNYYFQLMHRQYDAVKLGNKTIREALGFMGQTVETDIKQKIRDFKTPPNAAATIKIKGVDNPLQNNGHMLNSVRYIYRNK